MIFSDDIFCSMNDRLKCKMYRKYDGVSLSKFKEMYFAT